jgi:hypothetical protein
MRPRVRQRRGGGCTGPWSGREAVKRVLGPERLLALKVWVKEAVSVTYVQRDFHSPTHKSQVGQLASQGLLAEAIYLQSDVPICICSGSVFWGFPGQTYNPRGNGDLRRTESKFLKMSRI